VVVVETDTARVYPVGAGYVWLPGHEDDYRIDLQAPDQLIYAHRMDAVSAAARHYGGAV